jgi:hypothetical protein
VGERDGSAARDRSSWPVRIHALGDEPAGDLTATGLPAERLAMMESLAQDAFALTGRPLPDYSRAETPVVVRRLGE